MRRSSYLLLRVLTGCLCLGGCNEAIAVVEGEAATPPLSEPVPTTERASTTEPMRSSGDEALGQKLGGYVDCINDSSELINRSAKRYFRWVDRNKGLTGKERNVYGLYTVPSQEDCLEYIARANELKPDLPNLEAAAQRYATALATVQPFIEDAYRYYDEEDYRDDGFAKGRQLHPKLVAGFEEFAEADQALRDVYDEHNEPFRARELQRIEKEHGRKLLFLTKNVMAEANVLVATSTSSPPKESNLEVLQAELADFEAAVTECTTYAEAHEQETDSVMMYSMFLRAANDLRKNGKDLMRRKREGKPLTKRERWKIATFGYRTVEGHPDAVQEAYNALVDASNRLSWSRYEPSL